MKVINDFRIRIINPIGNRSYLTREFASPKISYFSGEELPLALSNLVGNRAAELRFDLQACTDGNHAAELVRTYVGNPAFKVEVLK